MTDRKQEAIKTIAEEFWGTQAVNYSPQHYAEGLYDLIAPLIRGKFPEGAYQKVIADAWCRGHNYVAAPKRKEPDWEDTSDLLAEAKRLWEGQEPLAEGDNILEQDVPKGTCPKCKGDGVVDVTKKEVICPDCKGTGECQHKGKMAYASADNDNWLPRCLDCGEEVDRRSGEERRIGKGRREYDIHGGLETSVGTFHIDRRKGTDRRKAPP